MSYGRNQEYYFGQSTQNLGIKETSPTYIGLSRDEKQMQLLVVLNVNKRVQVGLHLIEYSFYPPRSQPIIVQIFVSRPTFSRGGKQTWLTSPRPVPEICADFAQNFGAPGLLSRTVNWERAVGKLNPPLAIDRLDFCFGSIDSF